MLKNKENFRHSPVDGVRILPYPRRRKVTRMGGFVAVSDGLKDAYLYTYITKKRGAQY